MRRFCTGIQTNNQKLKKPCRVVKEKMETADRKKDFGLRMSEKQTYRISDGGCRRNRHIGYRMADVGFKRRDRETRSSPLLYRTGILNARKGGPTSTRCLNELGMAGLFIEYHGFNSFSALEVSKHLLG